uniref:Calx-beta domain-containing protein n=1 Tax=Bicosoecida sp. CB-2014 TaxID=1486930 RepID=A0A7S1G913_9STRA|mmetsp:Transcript_20272/g.71690  ORF Transcript_20272/g.71690 Transcript_20272/m.71690 type:complete len:912 (+) Transcript_20272:233-2968(+)
MAQWSRVAAVAALVLAGAATVSAVATTTTCPNYEGYAPAIVVCSYDSFDGHIDQVGGEYGGASGELGRTVVYDNDGEEHVLGKARLTSTPADGLLLQAMPGDHVTCGDGLTLPFFLAEDSWSRGFRTILYLVALGWSFLGIAIIADEFMAAIEVITSKEKVVTYKLPNGTTDVARVLVWNETIANLTLMALGSSAPEILLAVIETVTTLGDPPSDGLGPSTIVGSAAFNLLIIVGICVISIPKGETRKIKELGVFTVTAFFSVFAYVWMLFVLQWNTENVVDIWEALVTLFQFPLLVCLAWGQDTGWCRKRRGGVHPHTYESGTTGMGAHGYGAQQVAALLHDKDRGALGEMDEETLAELATNEIMANKKHSLAAHRVQAMRGLTGQGRAYVKRSSIVTLSEAIDKHDTAATPTEDSKEAAGESKAADDSVATLSFASPTYACLEDCGTIDLIVTRTGDMSTDVRVCYETSSGTATAPADYTYTAGTLTFKPGDDIHRISVPIVDDNEFEPDETFFCHLRLPGGKEANVHPVKLGKYDTTEVTIINDDAPGEFEFERPSYSVAESAGGVEVSIMRHNGSDGTIKVHYNTVDTKSGAIDGRDYRSTSGDLVFEHGSQRKSFFVPIIDDGDYEKDETFTLEFTIQGFPDCGATYGGNRQAVVTITNDEEFARMVDKVAKLINLNMDKMRMDTASWGEQFSKAMEPSGEDGTPSGMDYFMHFVSFFWKVLFAIVPPTRFYGGWATFAAALALIGALTAVVGDLASTFGCLLGLNDAVTAITFVALGTSLPDTFASKAAAVNDDTADASIGNVTGSNSVNVYLGLGLPWVIAAFYHLAHGTTYEVSAGSLSFSVLLFCVCAVACIAFIYARRLPQLAGAELGGPPGLKWFTFIFFFALWMVYVVVSALKSLGKLD